MWRKSRQPYSEWVILRTGGQTWYKLNNYISVDLAHHEIFHIKVGKGGISVLNTRQGSNKKCLLLI